MKKQDNGSKVFSITIGVMLAFYAFLMLLMIYFTVITSLKSFMDYDAIPSDFRRNGNSIIMLKHFRRLKYPLKTENIWCTSAKCLCIRFTMHL